MFRVHMPIVRNIRCWVAAYGFLHRVFGWLVVLRAAAWVMRMVRMSPCTATSAPYTRHHSHVSFPENLYPFAHLCSGVTSLILLLSDYGLVAPAIGLNPQAWIFRWLVRLVNSQNRCLYLANKVSWIVTSVSNSAPILFAASVVCVCWTLITQYQSWLFAEGHLDVLTIFF